MNASASTTTSLGEGEQVSFCFPDGEPFPAWDEEPHWVWPPLHLMALELRAWVEDLAAQGVVWACVRLMPRPAPPIISTVVSRGVAPDVDLVRLRPFVEALADLVVAKMLSDRGLA